MEGGGATIPRLRKSKLWDELLEFKPDLTFLIIGENDIRQGTSARALGIAIKSLCKEVEVNMGGFLVIVSILGLSAGLM